MGGLLNALGSAARSFAAPAAAPASDTTRQPQARGSTFPVTARATNDPAAAKALEKISSQWVDQPVARSSAPTPAGKDTAKGSGPLASVDPRGQPFVDPAPPNYGYPSRPVTDHVLNRARGGDATAPSNLDTKTWEANSRKAGFEGNYSRDLRRYMQQGLTRGEAEQVLQGEDDYIQTDVHARPVDPAALDTLPSQPQEPHQEHEE